MEHFGLVVIDGMQDISEEDIRRTRVISGQNGAEEAQMYRVMHTRRPLYSAERGEALSRASTGKDNIVGRREAFRHTASYPKRLAPPVNQEKLDAWHERNPVISSHLPSSQW